MFDQTSTLLDSKTLLTLVLQIQQTAADGVMC